MLHNNASAHDQPSASSDPYHSRTVKGPTYPTRSRNFFTGPVAKNGLSSVINSWENHKMMHTTVSVEDFDTPVETVDHLYRRFGAELRVFFKRRSRRNSPEDLVQHVFLRLLNCRGLSEVRDPQLYLYKIAWNVLYTENRRQKCEPPWHVSTEPERSEEVHSRLWDEGSFENVEDLADLEGALHTFRPEQRTVFLLYWKEGYTCEEVSEKTNINRHTVRKYLKQVMLQLRKYYRHKALHDE